MTPPSTRSGAARILVVLVPVLVAAAVLIVALLIGDDSEVHTSPATTSTSTNGATSTTASVTTTTVGATTSTGSPTTTVAGATDAAVWPTASSPRRFTDPVDAATAFAADFVGFRSPVVGEFQQGDSRSGEVEVRARAGAAVTTVLLRQLGTDATWSVIGAATADIEVDAPGALATIDRPVRLVGRARAFEGNVNVEVRADGVNDPLGAGHVTGRGDGVLGPFDSQLDYAPPTATGGSVVFLTYSAENGEVWQAAVVRVHFAPA